MAAPRYGLSIPDRGALYGVTTVGQILDQAAQAERECAPVGLTLSERGPRLGEGITILRRLWSEDAVGHEEPLQREKIHASVRAGSSAPILRFTSWDQAGQLARALVDVLPEAAWFTVPA